jgi:hypothetical protein
MTLSLFTSVVLIVPDHSIGTICGSYTFTIGFECIQWTETKLSNLIVSAWAYTTDTSISIPLLIGWTDACSKMQIEDSLSITDNTFVAIPGAVSNSARTLAFGHVTGN